MPKVLAYAIYLLSLGGLCGGVVTHWGHHATTPPAPIVQPVVYCTGECLV